MSSDARIKEIVKNGRTTWIETEPKIRVNLEEVLSCLERRRNGN